MTSSSNRDHHCFACNLCDAERTIISDDFTEAWGSLREEGWQAFRDPEGWKHTCPRCSD